MADFIKKVPEDSAIVFGRLDFTINKRYKAVNHISKNNCHKKVGFSQGPKRSPVVPEGRYYPVDDNGLFIYTVEPDKPVSITQAYCYKNSKGHWESFRFSDPIRFGYLEAGEIYYAGDIKVTFLTSKYESASFFGPKPTRSFSAKYDDNYKKTYEEFLVKAGDLYKNLPSHKGFGILKIKGIPYSIKKLLPKDKQWDGFKIKEKESFDWGGKSIPPKNKRK